MDHVGRFIFQSVHMLSEEEFDRAWGKKARRNNLVFIGRDLNAIFSIWGYGVIRVYLKVKSHFSDGLVKSSRSRLANLEE